MDYSQEATDEKAKILNEFGEAMDLAAKQTATQVGADQVSKKFVESAALTLRLRRPSGLPDFLVSAGNLCTGLGIGQGLSLYSRWSDAKPSTMHGVIVGVIIVFGLVALGAGWALKLRR